MNSVWKLAPPIHILHILHRKQPPTLKTKRIYCHSVKLYFCFLCCLNMVSYTSRLHINMDGILNGKTYGSL